MFTRDLIHPIGFTIINFGPAKKCLSAVENWISLFGAQPHIKTEAKFANPLARNINS